jgi:hypothetical protein
MMLEATRNYDQPLTSEQLFAWPASLVPDRTQWPEAHQGWGLAR